MDKDVKGSESSIAIWQANYWSLDTMPPQPLYWITQSRTLLSTTTSPDPAITAFQTVA